MNKHRAALLLLSTLTTVPAATYCKPQPNGLDTKQSMLPLFTKTEKKEKRVSTKISSLAPFLREHGSLIALSTGSAAMFITLGYLLKKFQQTGSGAYETQPSSSTLPSHDTKQPNPTESPAPTTGATTQSMQKPEQGPLIVGKEKPSVSTQPQRPAQNQQRLVLQRTAIALVELWVILFSVWRFAH